jgi:hypothetical protein
MIDVGGRPSIYTPELVEKLLDRICDCRSLRDVCKDEDMPSRQLHTKPEFLEKFLAAVLAPTPTLPQKPLCPGQGFCACPGPPLD